MGARRGYGQPRPAPSSAQTTTPLPSPPLLCGAGRLLLRHHRRHPPQRDRRLPSLRPRGYVPEPAGGSAILHAAGALQRLCAGCRAARGGEPALRQGEGRRAERGAEDEPDRLDWAAAHGAEELRHQRSPSHTRTASQPFSLQPARPGAVRLTARVRPAIHASLSSQPGDFIRNRRFRALSAMISVRPKQSGLAAPPSTPTGHTTRVLAT